MPSSQPAPGLDYIRHFINIQLEAIPAPKIHHFQISVYLVIIFCVLPSLQTILTHELKEENISAVYEKLHSNTLENISGIQRLTEIEESTIILTQL